MKKFLFSITALIIIILLVACTNHVSETSVNESEFYTTVALETTTKSSVSVTDAETTSSKKSEKHVTTRESTTENFSETTLQTTSISTTKPTTKKNEATKTTTTKPETTKVVPALPTYTPEEKMIELFNTVNNYRSENGLNKLSLDPEICKLAYIRAQEQELMEGHTRPNGSRFFTILGEYNYSYITCGENIALIWKNTSTRPFELWKTSETHNVNMLKAKWTKTGIAMYRNSDGRYNIVQLFAH